MLFMMISTLRRSKVKTFKMLKTLFDNDEIPEEKAEYECIPCIS